MTPRKIFFRILKSLITFIAVLGLIVAMLDFMDLSFALDETRHDLVERIKLLTGRDVQIEGDVKLTVSLMPELLVQKFYIRNPDNFNNEDFISISEVRVVVSLLKLLYGRLHFSEIAADQAEINLIQKKDGSHNWSFNNITPSSTPADSDTRKRGAGRLTMGVFQLSNVAIIYSDESRDLVIDTQLERLIIDIEDRKNPLAEISGSIQGFPYKLTVESDSLMALPSGKPWLVHGTGHIANKQTELEANLQVKNSVISGDLNIDVNKVNLGLLLDKMGIISGQVAATDNINIKAKVQGSNLSEIYEQAEFELQLGQGYWHLPSTETDQTKQLSFSRASCLASWNKPVELHMDGNIAAEHVKLDFKTNRLLEFFDEVKKLDVDLVSSVADTNITLNGQFDLPVKTEQFQLDISLKGKNLEKLNPVINAEFPPFNDFNLKGNLLVDKKSFSLQSTKAMIGESQLQASIVIETGLPKPLWTIKLNSQQIQLNDFLFDDWGIKQLETDTVSTSNQKSLENPLLKPLHQLEQLVRSPKSHVNLKLDVDKVLSGKDLLGKARFEILLRDDFISLKNADIEIPGGRVVASAALVTEGNVINGNAKLDIDKFNYGIATRIFKPESQVDGIFSTRIDLKLGGNNITRLLDNATGQVDIAIWPQNTQQVKILNLWATNLFLVLLPELKKNESKVNCMIGLMDLNDGVMKEEFFAIDTTKLWIYGNFDADFKQEQVKLSLFPRSKKARLFALQTPIRVQGSFTDIKMAVRPMDLAGTYISFITSPLHVPTRRIFTDKPPEDGSAICEQYLDRDYVKNINAEIKKKHDKEVDELLESD